MHLKIDPKSSPGFMARLGTFQFSEKRTGNIAKRRLLVNPYGPEFQTEFCYFLGQNDLNSEKGGIYESPPDRYVPNTSTPKNMTSSIGEPCRPCLLNVVIFLGCWACGADGHAGGAPRDEAAELILTRVRKLEKAVTVSGVFWRVSQGKGLGVSWKSILEEFDSDFFLGQNLNHEEL